MVVRYNDTKVLNVHLLKLTLVMLQIELVLAQVLHDYLADVTVFFQGVSKDEYIV